MRTEEKKVKTTSAHFSQYLGSAKGGEYSLGGVKEEKIGTGKTDKLKKNSKTDKKSKTAASEKKNCTNEKVSAKTGKSGKKAVAELKENKNAEPISFTREGETAKDKKTDKCLKVRFLGGVGEIGKNMTVLEYGKDIIVIDAGLTFPGESMPGVDLVIPDVTYLTQNESRIKGIVITHGHEDHIGALPYILQDLKVPVYGTKLTLTLIENKLKERRINDAKLNCVKAGSVVKLGCFSVEFINVNHSIAGAVGLSVTTPVGVVFHSGDFKIDFTPVNGEKMDLNRIAEIGTARSF